MNTPIACSLDAGNYQQRLPWIARINERYLLRQQQSGRVLVLSYRPEAREMLGELVRREQACCPFLTFRLAEAPESVELNIEVPVEAQASTDVLLAPFLGSGTGPEQCCANRCTADTPGSEAPVPRGSGRAPWVTKVSAVVATGALACGVCCVLPFVVPAVALTSVGGLLAWFGRAHAWITVAAVVLMLTAWVWVWRKSVVARARPGASTLFFMSAATIATLLAVAWPQMEPAVIALITS